jgi:hypothetical protein
MTRIEAYLKKDIVRVLSIHNVYNCFFIIFLMEKKTYIIIGIVILLIIIFLGIMIILRGDEDSWIKDPHGVWVKHGNPTIIPDEVKEQQDMINCAFALYSVNK